MLLGHNHATVHLFLTNNFPGNCFTSRFISRLNSATFTAELGRPLARMISSMLVSSSSRTASKIFCSFSFNSSAGKTPVSLGRRRTVARRKQILELAQNVLHAFAQLRAFFDEVVTALAARRINPPRHGKNLPAVFRRKIRRDERAAGQIRLDDDRAERHAGDDAVADGKGLLVRRAVEGKLRDDRAVCRDALEQLRVLRRRKPN